MLPKHPSQDDQQTPTTNRIIDLTFSESSGPFNLGAKHHSVIVLGSDSKQDDPDQFQSPIQPKDETISLLKNMDSPATSRQLGHENRLRQISEPNGGLTKGMESLPDTPGLAKFILERMAGEADRKIRKSGRAHGVAWRDMGVGSWEEKERSGKRLWSDYPPGEVQPAATESANLGLDTQSMPGLGLKRKRIEDTVG